MTASPTDDARQFQEQVASITDYFQSVWTGGENWKQSAFGAVASDQKNVAIEEVLNQVYRDTTTGVSAHPALGSREELRAAALDTKSALQTPSVRAKICRALGPIGGKSSREVAVDLTKSVLPLMLTGQIVFSASPIAWALLAFTIASIGVNWICGDKND